MSAEAIAPTYLGWTVLDKRGRWMGTVQLVHLNDKTGRPEWVTVGIGRCVKTRHIAPLAGSTLGRRHLRLPYHPSTIRRAPLIVDADNMNIHDQFALYSHYLQNLAPSSRSNARPHQPGARLPGH